MSRRNNTELDDARTQLAGRDIDTLRAIEALVLEEKWRRLELTFLLKPVQVEMWDAILATSKMKWAIKSSRRLGKSFLLCLFAVYVCLRRPNARVRFAAPHKDHLTEVIEPIMNIIFQCCPEELRAVWKKGKWIFAHNNSFIKPAGVNNKRADALRGPACDAFLIDEAQNVDDLNYLIRDVAFPQFIDMSGKVVAGRRLIVAGTSPKTPAHEFTELCRTAFEEGWLSQYDIYRGEYPPETIEIFKKEAGGEDSTTWKREYLCLDVVDSDARLIPEWVPEFEREPPIDEFFPYYHKYESLDIGVRDLTVCLFAHYDFKKATLFVHDEVSMNGPQMTTESLALSIRGKEDEVFRIPGKRELYDVHKRISDVDLLLINDLRALHRLPFNPTDKGELEQMINEVRIWAKHGRIVVHPRCRQTVGCLRYGIWNKTRTDFDRVAAYGHFDALAALMYLVRNVDTRTNPVPLLHGKNPEDVWVNEQPKERDKLKKMLGIKPLGRRGR